MDKVCTPRSTDRKKSYTREELVKLAKKENIKSNEINNLSKEELCDVLNIPFLKDNTLYIKQQDEEEIEETVVEDIGLEYYQGRVCNRIKGKKYPTAYTKKELVDIAVDKLDLPREKINSFSKERICKELRLYDQIHSKDKEIERDVEDGCIKRSNVKLNKHQKDLVEYIQTHRGAVAVHSTGSGKTLTAVISAECYLDKNPGSSVIVVTPKSLISNFAKEMEVYGGVLNYSKYFFYTYQEFANKFNNLIAPENFFLIIDEAHNLRTDIKTAAKHRPQLDQKNERVTKEPPIVRAKVAVEMAKKADKVLLLTATPVYNKPYDIVNLMAMVRGEEPLTPAEFDKIVNKDTYLFRENFKCIFSFYEKGVNKDDYPEEEEIEVEIEMSPEYYKKYLQVERKEIQISDQENPWIFLQGMRIATMGLEPCQKCDYTIDIIKQNQKTVVYSPYIEHGIEIIQDRLNRLGVDYVRVSGDISTNVRDEAVRRFNNPDDVKVLLITKAGSEGLDLKNTRHLIMMDPGWNLEGEKQIKGRAVRYKSHSSLPQDERKVTVHNLILMKPPIDKRYFGDNKKGSSDEILRKIIREKELINKDFLRRLKVVSIENEDCPVGMKFKRRPIRVERIRRERGEAKKERRTEPLTKMTNSAEFFTDDNMEIIYQPLFYPKEICSDITKLLKLIPLEYVKYKCPDKNGFMVSSRRMMAFTKTDHKAYNTNSFQASPLKFHSFDEFGFLDEMLESVNRFTMTEFNSLLVNEMNAKDFKRSKLPDPYVLRGESVLLSFGWGYVYTLNLKERGIEFEKKLENCSLLQMKFEESESYGIYSYNPFNRIKFDLIFFKI